MKEKLPAQSTNLFPAPTRKLITCFLLFIGCWHPALTQEIPNLQQVNIRLMTRNRPLDRILQEIEAQTPFRFVYNPAELKAAGYASLERRTISVEQALQELLPANFEFRQRGYNILILVREAPPPTVTNAAFTVTGRIIDANQQALPGVTITIKNSRNAAISNEQGNFVLYATRSDSLEISSIGFATITLPVQYQPMTILLSPNQRQALNEVIVIGYGNVQRKRMATAISTVSAAQLSERSASINIVEAMAGKIPGASIMLNSGKPGSSPTIKIRGTGSINASNAPLFVLDGIVGLDPVLIDPNIIQSVDILKDAASAAIYGSRGSNGVILMTSKQGVKNKSNIQFANRVSMGKLASEINLLDASGALEMIERQYAYTPGRLAPHKDPNNQFTRKNDLFYPDGTPRYNMNWQKEATRPAFSTNSSLTLRGGRDIMTSLVNISYKRQEGIMKNSYLEQINLFANLGWEVKPWLQLKTILNAGGLQSRNVDLNTLGFNAIREMYEYLPFIPVKYNDGSWSRKGDYPGAEQSENPLRLLNDVKSVTGQTYAMGNITGTVHLHKKLDLVTSFSGQLGGSYHNYFSAIGIFGFSDIQNGVAQRSNGQSGAWTNEDYLSYNDRFGKHRITALAGASWYFNAGSSTFAGSENFFDNLLGYNSLQSGAMPQGPSSQRQQNQMNSFFGRLLYDYDGRYLGGASFRVDGSSRFGKNNKYGYFPAVWGAWLVSGEEFFAGLHTPFNYLKLRVSWGITGNAEIGNYATLSLLNPSQVVFNGSQQPAVVLSNPGNRNLKWERGKQWNIGLDGSILEDHLSFSVEWYRKLTSDLLYNRQLPATTGYSSIYDNVGSILNHGLELSLRSRNITRARFSWSSGLNFFLSRSKVLHLNGDIIYNWAGRIMEGQPIDQYFGYYRLGTWQSSEAAEAARYGRKPGDIKYADNNKNGVKDAGDRIPLGSKMPRYQCDLTNTFSSGPFSLFLDISGMFGHKLANFPRYIMESPTTSVNSFSNVLKAWTPEQQQTNLPQLRLQSDGADNEMDNYYIEDGSFIRFRNIALSYELSPALLRKLHMEKCSIGINAENYLLFTKYRGYDPETTSFDGDLNQGVDVYQYPKAKTLSFTLQVTF
ncbi:MAG: TonB-dependent receptor [Candidatus Pseudobacter hemicellulosilyticus]|uniref:TonB-dependent receptor n=1 Tax=Candidatus Pseudobacter hemicellulosilyticus TaxID=3121375 RepID=A0AAJ6BFV1_9BACT|nr:MAG: TonB-dependent receptor [Pseudobacter sp.]